MTIFALPENKRKMSAKGVKQKLKVRSKYDLFNTINWNKPTETECSYLITVKCQFHSR